MVPIKAVALSLLAPAVAIVTGAFMQQALIWVWPGVQFHTIFSVSFDTWLGVAAIGGLTFWAGLWIRRSATGHAMIIPALVSPIIWLLLCQFAVNTPSLQHHPLPSY